ncbi:hypothetical protein PO909_008342 [Leuciscus waleckii]
MVVTPLFSKYYKLFPYNYTYILYKYTIFTESWTEDAQKSFEKVKELIVNSPALAIFDPALRTLVTCDASDYGIGAVLTQIHADGSERTVAFASHSLSAAERKYSIVEKEALACVWAVERWRTFLWGRRFTLRTDHQALTTLLATKGMGRAGMRIARWSARLLCFNYEVSYKPGAENVTADCLSRLPLPACEDADSTMEPDMVAFLSAELRALSLEEFSKECTACPELTALRQQILIGWPKNKKNLPPELASYFHVRDELAAQDSLVFRGSYRLVVPVSLRGALINLAHQGHQGIVRTKQRLRDLYWWPAMDHSAQSAISSCKLCQTHDKSAKTYTPPLQPMPLPSAPWEKVGLDIVGPFKLGTWDCRYALTLVDYYSKWPEIAFLCSCWFHPALL